MGGLETTTVVNFAIALVGKSSWLARFLARSPVRARTNTNRCGFVGLVLNITAAFFVPFCYNGSNLISCTAPPQDSTQTQLQFQYKVQQQVVTYRNLKISAGVFSFTGTMLAALGICVLNSGLNRIVAVAFIFEAALSIACWSIAATWGMGPGGAIMVAVSVTALVNTALALIAARKAAYELASGDFGSDVYEPMPNDVYAPMPRQPPPPGKALPPAELPQGGA
jgi:hypothetical protein